MKFYGHFAAAYGTIWLGLLGFALATRSHVNAGGFGVFGFPILAALYGLVRWCTDDSASEVRRLRQRVEELEWELAHHENA